MRSKKRQRTNPVVKESSGTRKTGIFPKAFYHRIENDISKPESIIFIDNAQKCW